MGHRRALPAPIVPMLATSGPVPEGGGEAGWAYEFKWDGVRCVAAVDPGGLVRATSRNLREITRSYPELRELATLVDRRVVLDGELVVLDEEGRPSFPLLAHRMHVQAPTAPLLARLPVRYYIFDLLYLDDQPLLTVPWRDRREQLAQLELNEPGVVRTPPSYTDISGADLLAVAAEAGLEGIVSKRITSHYYPGKRSRAWLKHPLRHTQEVIIGGWTEGEGRRRGTLGALLLGVHDEASRLRFVGHVGTGFSDAMLRELQAMLESRTRTTSPFDEPVPSEYARRAHWVHPELVGEIEHRQWTRPDNRLRHPSWRGLRPDRSPDEVKARFSS